MARSASGTHTPFFGIKGRNGDDDPFLLPSDQCCEALNGDWYGAALFRRRGGAAALAITGGTAFGSGIRTLLRHVPGSDQSAAELWGWDGAGLTKRLAGGTSWANVSYADAISGSYGDINGVSFNGKFYLCYDSAVNRLHQYNATDASVVRVGLAVAAAPTAANTGSGSYAATARYYKVRFVRQVSSVTTVAGELSAAVSFTPSGSGTAARVTKPTSPGETETHWELFGSPDDSDYFSIAVTAIGTTTYDDSANPLDYDGDLAPDEGAYLPPPSAKYIVADDARLIMAGAWETSGGEVSPLSYRVWWTSSLGSSDIGDDQRISITDTIANYDDVDEPVTGLSRPVQGAFFVYSYNAQWKFVATGDFTNPYQRFRVTGGQGCISHKGIIVATDGSGYPATYWLSSRGVERSSRDGAQFCSADMTDIWATVNKDATTLPHGVYHEDIHQIWWYVATGASNTPTLKMVFDTWLGRVTEIEIVRYGWSQHTGESAKAYCSCMFAGTVAASMSRALKPYIGYVTSTAIWKCDTTDTDDAGNAFQAYVESKPLAPWGLGRKGGLLEEPMLVAAVAAGVTIRLTINKDEGAETATADCVLTKVSSGNAETRIFPQFEAAKLGNAKTIRFRLGDAAAASVTQWLLDALVSPMGEQGER